MMRERVQRLFPPGVVVEVATEADENEALLYDGERALMGAMVPVRRREFSAGRNTARRALGRLGFTPGELVRQSGDRDVAWPASSIGSISHTRGLCAVACARTSSLTSLGLDVEQAGPLGSDIVSAICRPDELSAFASVPPPLPSDWPKLVFAMKEAAYKAWYPVARRMLAFHDMLVVPEIDSRQFQALVQHEPVPRVAISGRFGWDDDFVYAGAVLTGH